jgi:formate hydrogenlyase transcriptional activator
MKVAMLDSERSSEALVNLQFQTLLEVSESIVSHTDLSELFQDLAQRLIPILGFDFLNLVLHDPERQMMRCHVLKTLAGGGEGPKLEFSVSINEAPSGHVWQTQSPFVIPSLARESRFPKVLHFLRGYGVKSYCLVPLSTTRRRLGAMGFGSVQEGAFGQADLTLLQGVATQVAIAVENALIHESHQAAEKQLASERDHLRVLLDVNTAVGSTLDLQQLLGVVAGALKRMMVVEYVTLALYDPERNKMRVHALHFPGGRGLITTELLIPVDDSPGGRAFSSRKPVRLNLADLKQFHSEFVRLLLAEGVQSMYCVPLVSPIETLGSLNFGRMHDNAFTQEDTELLAQVASQIGIAVGNALAFGKIEDLKNKLAEEKLYLEDEIRTEYNFDEIIGGSAALMGILKQVEIVASTESIVLIQGETGTGKELIARAIHNLSGRRERTFIKVNCAAIPSGLLESELFGHEKGAFTGAIASRVGRFELADRGTLFLDEVGEVPLELQPKLLRVLQEQEFERLGSTQTVRVNVRLVAATNRDLEQMVEDNQFRRDLFYRFNVFPIVVPPLRERRGDIPTLVRHFVRKFSRRMNKRVERIPTETLDALTSYTWPGNIRELENVIERAVILSPGPVLHVPLKELKSQIKLHSSDEHKTLGEVQHDHILRTLRSTKWVIGGPSGAAVRLGIKRATLQYRMRKLGISRPS